MKLEDAFLYVVVDDGLTGDALVTACGRVIAGGGDILQIAAGDDDTPAAAETARRIGELCRREEALLVVRGDARRAVEWDASGVHLSESDQELALARTVLGPDRMVGVSSRTLDGARLSLEIGADYLLHHAGRGCAEAFAALKAEARVPLFAAGLESLEDARALVEAEIFRLCIDAARLDAGDLTEAVAGYARLLGRCL